MIKDRIKERRLMLKLTQDELGKMVGASKFTISKYERGINEPDLQMINKLSKALECDVEYLTCKNNEIVKGMNPQIKKIIDAFKENGIDVENIDEDILNKIVKTYKMFNGCK